MGRFDEPTARPQCRSRSSSFARGVGTGGQKVAAFNVRCLEGVDPSKLEVKQFDGRSR